MERGHTDGRHWTRCEIQLRRENAKAFIERYLSNNESISRTFQGVVFNYLRYIKPSKTDQNKRRAKTAKYWQKFIDEAEKIKLYKKPGVEYNLSNLEYFAVDMAGSAVKTYIEIFGIHQYLNEIYGKEYQNPKYAKLESQYKDKKRSKYEVLFPKKKTIELVHELLNYEEYYNE